MSDNVTIARPYAKAIFDHASENKQLAPWSVTLENLAQVILDPRASRFISNPECAADLQEQLLLAVLSKSSHQVDKDSIEKLIRLLITNKRLSVLPDIFSQFELLRAEREKTLTVDVTSFSELNEIQEQQLVQSLSQRLQRQVKLNIQLDKSLLGGAIIHAGDLVIDGSVRGKLNKLSATLAA